MSPFLENILTFSQGFHCLSAKPSLTKRKNLPLPLIPCPGPQTLESRGTDGALVSVQIPRPAPEILDLWVKQWKHVLMLPKK
jgi:hypothetical protein